LTRPLTHSGVKLTVVNRVFQTQPLIIHAHGPLLNKPAWPRIREAVFSNRHILAGQNPSLTLLTCNNGAEGMGLFEKSTGALGIPCLVRGEGIVPWIHSRHKPMVIRSALDEIDTEYVLYADSRDAVILRDPRAALDRFARWDGCKLLFGGDKINWPALREFRKFEQSIPGASETDFRYLNGGAWIGRTDFCREFFSAVIATAPVPEAPDSEQGILKKVFATFYPDARIDYRCEIFQNIGFVLSDIFDIKFDGLCDDASEQAVS
jgi:hypothetical protein